MAYNPWPLKEQALFESEAIDSWFRPIGLIGYAGTGKDWLAQQLIAAGDDPPFTRVSFADKVRELALRVDPILAYGDSEIEGGPIRLSDHVQAVGWEEAKKDPEVRRLLQEIGTGVRDLVGEDVWVNAADVIDRAHEGPVVVTDVRFPNEARLIERLGGVLVRVIRPGVGPVNGHRSERALDGWAVDLTVLNDPQKVGYKAYDGTPVRPIPVVNAIPQLYRLGHQRTHGRIQ